MFGRTEHNQFVEDRSDVRRQIEEMRSTLAQKGALTADQVHSTLENMVQVAEKLASQLGDVDRALQAVEEVRSRLGDVESRLKQTEDQTGKPAH